MSRWMQKLTWLGVGLVSLTLLISLRSPLSVSADSLFTGSRQEACNATATGSSSTGSCTGNGSAIDNLLTAALDILSLAIGVIAVIMIIIGGLKYIMSAGDSNAISSAKNTLVYAVVGLVIVAFAQIIVNFVVHRVRLPACPAKQTQINKPGDCIVP